MVEPVVLVFPAEFIAFQNSTERGILLATFGTEFSLSIHVTSAIYIAASFATVHSRFAIVQLEAWFVLLKGTLLETLKGFHLGNLGIFHLQFTRNHQGL